MCLNVHKVVFLRVKFSIILNNDYLWLYSSF